MNRTRLTLTALAVSAVATLALGQNADKNSAGPTKNDYRLRVIEPVEGATITGGTVRVVVNTEIPGETDTKRDDNSMPRPMVDIFIDNNLKGTLRDEINVLSVDAVTPGQHKLVVLAKNQSQEIIDRKEIKFNVVAAASMSERPATTSSSTLEERRVQSAPPPAAPRPQMSTPQPSAPPMPASDPMPQTRPQTAAPTSETRTKEARLPATGTSDLAVAAAGLALLVGGLSLRRRV